MNLPRSTNGTAGEDELAIVLDDVIDGLHAGRPIDHEALLRRYPELVGALDALARIGGQASTVLDQPARLSTRPLPERVGPYQVEQELGTGGFGVVYRAFDPHLRRRVAVKVLHADRLEQPEAVERFRREAHATARLRHPGIVQLYEFSRDGPPFYLVTEYVEGTDPCTWCARTRATPTGIAGLVARIGDAVDYAHQQGVCHRDLKPANILIDEEGNPHVLDFGLARLEALEDSPSQAPTSDGRVIGSLAYMAPEQAAGHSHSADARTDVYGLGVVLYQLLTGRLPFQGPAHALPARVMEEAPLRLREIDPVIPADLEAICEKAMAKRPEDRYPSAKALAADLRAFLQGDPVKARPRTWPVRLQQMLARRHHEAQARDWSAILLLSGVVIFLGCAVVNAWEWFLVDATTRWLAVLGTKLVQIAVMVHVAVWFRPFKQQGMTAVERQIWVLVPGYFGATFTLMVLNLLLPQPVPLPPILATLSGLGFWTLGAGFWGWFYVWGVAFFLLALAMAFCLPVGWLLLGTGWLACLLLGCVHLRRRR